MNSIEQLSTEDLDLLLRRARTNAKEFVSNFYIPPAQWAAWIQRGLQVLHTNDRFVLLTRPEEKCIRLFFAGDRAALNSSLSAAKEAGLPPRAVDLIGRRSDVQSLVADFSAAGFKPHLRLDRLSRMGPFAFPDTVAVPLCDSATASDVTAVQELLHGNFDIFADQLPSAVEIRKAIELQEVRAVHRAGHLEGFLWYVKTGVTSVIRYWCVDPLSSGRGVGGRLMRDYFVQTRECIRHLLWVRENNATAAASYKHYGYTPDGLEDQVMVQG